MFGLFRFVLIYLMFSTGTTTAGNAASFDCSKATTETETGICNDPELSKLDELIADIYFSLDKQGRYFEKIVDYQRNWIKAERSPDSYNLNQQMEFLIFGSILNSCSRGAESTFGKCIEKLEIPFDECQSKENYTTLVMNRCSGAYLRVFELVESFETHLWRKIHSDDKETVTLFDEAQLVWKEFVDADCAWQYSEFRGGTIRGLIWLGCKRDHYEYRILLLNNSNQSQG